MPGWLVLWVVVEGQSQFSIFSYEMILIDFEHWLVWLGGWWCDWMGFVLATLQGVSHMPMLFPPCLYHTPCLSALPTTPCLLPATHHAFLHAYLLLTCTTCLCLLPACLPLLPLPATPPPRTPACLPALPPAHSFHTPAFKMCMFQEDI